MISCHLEVEVKVEVLWIIDYDFTVTVLFIIRFQGMLAGRGRNEELKSKVDIDGFGTIAPRHKKSGNAQSFSELIWFNS